MEYCKNLLVNMMTHLPSCEHVEITTSNKFKTRSVNERYVCVCHMTILKTDTTIVVLTRLLLNMLVRGEKSRLSLT